MVSVSANSEHAYTRGAKDTHLCGLHVGMLAYDNIENVQRIVAQEVSMVADRRPLAKQLDAVVELIKFYYYAHVAMDYDSSMTRAVRFSPDVAKPTS